MNNKLLWGTGVCMFLLGGCLLCGSAGTLGYLYLNHGGGVVAEDRRTLDDLVKHFEAKGLKGKKNVKSIGLDTAAEGIGYSGDGFIVECYRYPDEAKAKEAEAKDRKAGHTMHRRGKFLLMVHEGEGRVLPAFRSF